MSIINVAGQNLGCDVSSFCIAGGWTAAINLLTFMQKTIVELVGLFSDERQVRVATEL